MAWDNKREIEKINRDLGGISFQDQRVLVTGGAGFLGSWMCDVLVAQGAEVICRGQPCERPSVQHLASLGFG